MSKFKQYCIGATFISSLGLGGSILLGGDMTSTLAQQAPPIFLIGIPVYWILSFALYVIFVKTTGIGED